jgi:hypothetical protein
MEMCSLGPSYGIIIFNGLVKGGENIAKAKFEIADKQERICKGD